MKFKDLNLLDVGDTIQMVGAIFSGKGKTLLCFLPTAGGDVHTNQSGDAIFSSFDGDKETIEALNMTPDEWAGFLNQTDVLNTEALVKNPDGTITKAIVRKSQRQIEQGVSWTVFRRDGYKCRYCGKDDVPLTVDHLVLWEEGGPSIEANLLTADRKCNKIRGNTQYKDWLKHPHYVKVSKSLTEAQRQANLQLVETLDKIPRASQVRSR